ncbi:MAG: MBL fold metallo-hydrolase [Clostridia bacterium]|nr:MBL fold metallo-hydrolase [Clostridia bacterium]
MIKNILRIKYANSFLPENAIFPNGAEGKKRYIDFFIYLIETENRKILIDAGCRTMPGFDMKNFIGPVKALASIGASAQSITDVIITHAHHDHIEAAECFKNAVFYIQAQEYEYGRDYLKGLKTVLFEEKYDLTQDIKIIKLGGHSIGSSIVEARFENQTYIFAGDECYLKECLERSIPTASSYCPEKSLYFIKKYSKMCNRVYLSHSI